MSVQESERRELATQLLIISCPSCHQDTNTGFSLWDNQVMAELPDETLEFDCHRCDHHIIYTPSTHEAIVAYIVVTQKNLL